MDTNLVVLLITGEQERAIRVLFAQKCWKYFKISSRAPFKEELDLLYQNIACVKAPDSIYNLPPYIPPGYQENSIAPQMPSTGSVFRPPVLSYSVSELIRDKPCQEVEAVSVTTASYDLQEQSLACTSVSSSSKTFTSSQVVDSAKCISKSLILLDNIDSSQFPESSSAHSYYSVGTHKEVLSNSVMPADTGAPTTEVVPNVSLHASSSTVNWQGGQGSYQQHSTDVEHVLGSGEGNAEKTHFEQDAYKEIASIKKSNSGMNSMQEEEESQILSSDQDPDKNPTKLSKLLTSVFAVIKENFQSCVKEEYILEVQRKISNIICIGIREKTLFTDEKSEMLSEEAESNNIASKENYVLDSSNGVLLEKSNRMNSTEEENTDKECCNDSLQKSSLSSYKVVSKDVSSNTVADMHWLKACQSANTSVLGTSCSQSLEEKSKKNERPSGKEEESNLTSMISSCKVSADKTMTDKNEANIQDKKDRKYRWSVSRNLRMHGCHRKVKVIPPDLCDKGYSKTEKGFFCKDCMFLFRTEKQFKLHKDLKGGLCSPECLYCDKDNFKDLFQCTVCPKCFRTEEMLVKHMERHSLVTFPCQHCDCLLHTSSQLRAHVQSCHPEEVEVPYLCDLCGSKFNEKKVLNAHRKYVHTNDCPEVCPTCGNRFKTKSQLKNHLVRHKNVDELNLSCEICGKMFLRAATLRDHVRRHKKEFTIFCTVCDKGFYRKYGLDEHMRVHTGVKPFECKICPFKCALRCNLVKHMKTHSKIMIE